MHLHPSKTSLLLPGITYHLGTDQGLINCTERIFLRLLPLKLHIFTLRHLSKISDEAAVVGLAHGEKLI
ncbi:hypothetical protein DPMN_115934 [Dreissena polymorpha]|uniref:Uncharacterized protein n=1 Tax=Dreissena polymorpha TaxID=45954 RepID=A0A9D4KMX1_DREPO|nr:hypothetical protein DPMN_115934 [Dreissena polymorpha]